MLALISDGRCHLESKDTELELDTARCSGAPGPSARDGGKEKLGEFRGFRALGSQSHSVILGAREDPKMQPRHVSLG